MNEQDWKELDDSWDAYVDASNAWLKAARDPNADPQETDELTHKLILTHQDWGDRLAKAIADTHHH